MANRNTLLRDMLFFIKNYLSTNITDPISGTRKTNSTFVATSYPQREVNYPLITVKIPNLSATRAGMQTDRLDIQMNVEVRVWARNEKEKDTLYNQVMDELAKIQFTASGSVNSDFHDFTVLSSVEVDEDGKGGIKSRVLQVQYMFFDA